MATLGVIDLSNTVTVHEASRFADRHEETIKRWLREGRLKGRKVGLVWYIDATDLRETLGAEHPERRTAA